MEASARPAAPLNPLIGGTTLPVGFVLLTLTGEMVPGTVVETLVTERVDVVVFKATILVDEKLPNGAEVVSGFVAPQAPVGGLVPVTVTVLVDVEVMVVVKLVVVLVDVPGEEEVPGRELVVRIVVLAEDEDEEEPVVLAEDDRDEEELAMELAVEAEVVGTVAELDEVDELDEAVVETEVLGTVAELDEVDELDEAVVETEVLGTVDELDEPVLLVVGIVLLLIRCVSSLGHSRAFPFLGIHPIPVEAQFEVEVQASIIS